MEFTIDKVTWKKRFPSRGIDPRKAHDAIEKLENKTAENLVDLATSCDVLHIGFDWNNKIAGHEHRLTQARAMMRALVVTYVNVPEEPVRAFEVTHRVEVGESKKPVAHYGTQEDAMKNPESRDRLMKEAIQALMSWRRRFQFINKMDRNLGNVVTAIDDALDSFNG